LDSQGRAAALVEKTVNQQVRCSAADNSVDWQLQLVESCGACCGGLLAKAGQQHCKDSEPAGAVRQTLLQQAAVDFSATGLHNLHLEIVGHVFSVALS
jgi:hypothetical protein